MERWRRWRRKEGGVDGWREGDGGEGRGRSGGDEEKDEGGG